MATPEKHAICSASSSERWLNCTAAPRYEQQFEPTTSEYAEEGRLAHALCELEGRRRFDVTMTEKEYNNTLEAIEQDKLYSDEMAHTAEFYVNYLAEKAMTFNSIPVVFFELQVDFSEYVPSGFGTCDNVMIGGNTLRITDYKHGKGIKVDSHNNSQMRLYALGALEKFRLIYGDSIKTVITAIVQPRISDDVTEDIISTDELLAWGESVKEKAQKAFTGVGAEFVPGDWCRFCRGNSVCKARAAKYSAFEDFKDCIPSAEKPKKPTDNPCLSDEEVADLLTRGAAIVEWYNDLCAYAQKAILDGKTLPGWKVVAGKSNRKFTDIEKVEEVLIDTLNISNIYKPRELLTLTELEKKIGKKAFAEYLGPYVEKPVGKPTLVPESDKREPYSSAVSDFTGVGSDAK